MSIQPRGGEPQIRTLTGLAIQVVEGHFPPPIGKTDVLKAPKHFPVPVMRYTLREMTLLWEIFGGHDFPKHTAPSSHFRYHTSLPPGSFQVVGTIESCPLFPFRRSLHSDKLILQLYSHLNSFLLLLRCAGASCRYNRLNGILI